MSEKKYWIWLSLALGAGARTDEILGAFSSARSIYEAGRTERAISGVFSKAKLDRLDCTKISDAERYIEICGKNGWKIYTPGDDDYPDDLRNLTDMPLVLYCDGDLACIKERIAIGVVGTRNPTRDSTAIARQLSSDMAKCGAVIVSGGALGIDSAAHEGALGVNGTTVCVLGCGLGAKYLMRNEPMRREIAKSGAVISEFSPLSEAGVRTFPVRNRIISGLSKGVLVVEAGEKSGSLITARAALEQGREVFAVPGSILTSSYKGANTLIRDGATAVTCAADILQSFEYIYPGALDLSGNSGKLPEGEKRRGDKKANPVKKLPADYDADSSKVFALLSDDPLHSDEICAMTGLPPSKVMGILTRLELDGFAEQTEGKNYILA
jgi:DNA processing protein